MPSTEFSRRAVLSGLAAATAAGLAGCSALGGGPEPEPLPDATPGPDDWPTSGYDARNTRYNADAAPPRAEPSPRWTREFRYCHRPVVRGTRVVLNADGRTVGLRATDGERRWRGEREPWNHETPTLGTDRAYVTGTDCAFGLDLDGGEVTWQGDPCHGANTKPGTIAGGRLYMEYGGYFSALDATGRVTWAARNEARGSPSVVGDTAFVATSFTVEAVDLTADASEWPWEDGDDDEPAHAPREASTKWSVPPESRISGPRVYHSPAVSEATVFATLEREDAPGGELRALARTDGAERWVVAAPPEREVGEEPPDAPDPVGRPVPPVVTDDLVVTALGDRRLRALTHGGEAEWTRPLDHEVTDLVAAGDTAVVAFHDRTVESTGPGHAGVAAFDLGSGSRLWTKAFEDHVEGLAVAGGTVYATVVTGRDAESDVTGMELLALG